MHDVLAAKDGNTVLHDISVYGWEDQGAKAGESFAWIERDASSDDIATSTRAGETAQVLASFLGDNQAALASISHGFLGLRHTSIGSMNPKLVAAYGLALAPFQAAMVGNTSGVHGFGPLGDITNGDYSKVVGVFAVIASDPEAGEGFIKSGYDRASALVDDAAAGCADPAAAHAAGPALTQAGALSGSMSAAVQQPGAAALATKNLAAAMNDAALAITVKCLQSEANPPSYLREYMTGSALLTPEQVGQRKGEQFLTEYYSGLKSYVGEKKFDLNVFYTAFQMAAGLGAHAR